ncbi:PPOX class F420-dependent oxidoreductase [Actinoplanes derwentensis]|uniref:Uncharacterized protein n=1 Tax=Actinoplanes derwentensis TaxID=113562 RepID=A0A1H1X482_9ACTN|nr:PPOX class F420-dependent oxidoreductase [Actinoplanes derwentensis]GID85743.1 hypothetical protein Ade03nite_46670 [Actinoplanes derwentensis]SDT03399.1 hypothetical protein SAMN04489716_2315 [Actinoplanes derwentensis]
MTVLDELGAARYVLLTTFRRDGRAVPTAVWILPAPGGELAIWTGEDTGKLKRIRRDHRVTLAPCTVRGRVLGETVPATARIGDREQTRWAAGRIPRKYGLIGLSVFLGSLLRNRRIGGVAVFLTLADGRR